VNDRPTAFSKAETHSSMLSPVMLMLMLAFALAFALLTLALYIALCFAFLGDYKYVAYINLSIFNKPNNIFYII
jgi:hypothetical protein